MVNLLIAMLMSTGLLRLDGLPFERPPSDMATLQKDGSIAYAWPPARMAWFALAPLERVDALLHSEGFRAAVIERRARHDLLGLCPTPASGCLCMNGIMVPKPVGGMLADEQWEMLFERVRWDAQRSGDTKHVRALLDRLVRAPDADPIDLPDLTPLLLAAVEAAARGDRTLRVQAEFTHNLSMQQTDLFDRAVVRASIADAIVTVDGGRNIGALKALARSLGMDALSTGPGPS